MNSGIRLSCVRLKGQRRLCLLRGDELFAIEGVGELGELAAGGSETLEEMIASAAIARRPLGTLDDLRDSLVPPVNPPEVWAAGVTYERSRDARRDESSADESAYQRVYDAERPELFLKATGWRVAGPNAPIGLRSDSNWQVPEPELGVVLGSRGEVVGYLLGNDQTCRDIEAENTLYLPQAKIFASSCSLGPVLASPTALGDLRGLELCLSLSRGGDEVWRGSCSIARLRRSPHELAGWLVRDNPIRFGTVLLTGTGIVPPERVTTEPGDVVSIAAAGLGSIVSRCVSASELADSMIDARTG